MKNHFLIMATFFASISSLTNASSLLNNYREYVQKAIDQKRTVNIATFTPFIDNFEQQLQDEAQKFMGLKPYIKPLVEFVKNIALHESVIVEDSVPDYGDSFTIEAVIYSNNQRIPVYFTAVSDIRDIEHFSFALSIPDEFKIADFTIPEMSVFDNFFKNRWLVLSLFTYQDSHLGAIAAGLNIIADSDAQTVEKNLGAQYAWLHTIIGYAIPTMHFVGSIPLATLGLAPALIGNKVPVGVSFDALQSLIQLKATIGINKPLYKHDGDAGIQAVIVESCDVTAGWGAKNIIQKIGFNIANAFRFGLGVTTRVQTAMGPDIIAYGGLDIKPLVTTIHAKVDGEIKNPFGIPWISLHKVGFDFPLTVAGVGITGVGMRAQISIGQSFFEAAGKTELGMLGELSLVLHGKAKHIPFAAFIRGNNQMFGWMHDLVLNHAQVTLAFGNTVIAGKEFKSGIIVKAQVDNSILDKKAGFQLYALNAGTYYQFFGNGYLPTVHTNLITFENADTLPSNQQKIHHPEGPRFEFSYVFDFAFAKLMQASLKAQGRVKIGSFFDGTADVDLNTIKAVKNTVSDWKKAFVALLRGQRLIVKGRLFNTFEAELQILESTDKDVYVKINGSQRLVSSWEKGLRKMVIVMKESVQKSIESLDERMETLTEEMDDNAVKALERAAQLSEDNEALKQKNREIQNQIKSISWSSIYKAIPLKVKQGYYMTLIASNADLLNTLLMHASCTQATLTAFTQLRKAKKQALAFVEGASQVVSLGVGILGIEKVEAHGWLHEIMYNRAPLLFTVELKVNGEQKIIREIPFDGAHPFDSTRHLIKMVTEQMFL